VLPGFAAHVCYVMNRWRVQQWQPTAAACWTSHPIASVASELRRLHSHMCTGGQPYSVFGVLDAMRSIKPDIQTLGLGACYSYASLILVRGADTDLEINLDRCVWVGGEGGSRSHGGT
jgi:hypothetical protein